MLTDLSTIPDKDELLDILGIDEKAFDIISVLYLSVKEEPNITELLKKLEKHGMSLTKNTLFKRLDILEDKKYITKKRKGQETHIKLNDEGFLMLFSNGIISGLENNYRFAKKEVSELSLDQIFKKFEYYSVNKGFLTFYFKLLFSLNPIDSKENAVIAYSNKVYDNIIDIYIDDLKRRGIKDTLNLLSKMEKIMNEHPDRILNSSLINRFNKRSTEPD